MMGKKNKDFYGRFSCTVFPSFNTGISLCHVAESVTSDADPHLHPSGRLTFGLLVIGCWNPDTDFLHQIPSLTPNIYRQKHYNEDKDDLHQI